MKFLLLTSFAMFSLTRGLVVPSTRLQSRAVLPSFRESPTALDASPLDRPLRAAVDGAALVAFAAIGKSSHATDGSIDATATLAVAAPFLLSWWATSPFTNVYDDSPEDLPGVFLQTARGWIVSVPLGIALRGFIKGYVPPTSFIAVTMVATLVILAVARVALALIEEKLLSSDTN